MQFKQHTPVYTNAGENVGKVDRIALDPKSREVTYLIVRKGFLFTEDKLLPIELVQEATEDRVTLAGDAGNLDRLPVFEETQYLPLDLREGDGVDMSRARERADDSVIAASTTILAPSLFWYPSVGIGPQGYPNWVGPTYVERTETNVPEDAVALQTGVSVTTRDGKNVGAVDEVIARGQDHRATHLVVSHGVVFKKRKAVPVQWIDDVSDGGITLGVHSDLVTRLPDHHP